nr:BLTX150 [Nephila pilipes]
MLSWFCL